MGAKTAVIVHMYVRSAKMGTLGLSAIMPVMRNGFFQKKKKKLSAVVWFLMWDQNTYKKHNNRRVVKNNAAEVPSKHTAGAKSTASLPRKYAQYAHRLERARGSVMVVWFGSVCGLGVCEREKHD